MIMYIFGEDCTMNQNKRFSVTIPQKLEKDYKYLIDLGYKPAEIGREGLRLFAAKKRSEEVPA